MSEEFEKLKRRKRSSDSLDRLVQSSLDELNSDREVTYDKLTKRKRIENSLLWSDDKECHSIRGKMEKCKSFQSHQRMITKNYTKYFNEINVFKDIKGYIGKYINRKEVCQSLWCPNCRKFVTQLYEKKISDRLTQRLLPTEYSNNDFHHISGVLGICKVDEKEVLRLIKDDTNRWRRIRYRLNTKILPKDCPFIETVYEFELVNWRFLKSSEGSDFKKKQIQQLMEHQRFKGDVFLFVHFHSITNLTKDQINDVFRDEYFVGDKPLIKTNQTNGLYVQKFRSEQTLEQNIEKLCSYPFKDPHRYKHSFRGSDYLNGEYYEDENLSKLIKVYQKVQKRNWRGLFRSVEHHRSMEFVRSVTYFPSDHMVWDGDWYRLKDVSERSSKLNRITLEKVWMVDVEGNTYTEGWNPNWFFPNGFEMSVIQRHKTKLGRELVELTHRGETVFDHNDQPIMIWRNKYHYFDDSRVVKKIHLEQFYYPKEFKLLGKDQYIGINNFGWYQKEMSMRGREIDVIDGYKIPFDIEFSIEDERFIQRLETLKRLDQTDKFMVCKMVFDNYRYRNGIRYPQFKLSKHSNIILKIFGL